MPQSQKIQTELFDNYCLDATAKLAVAEACSCILDEMRIPAAWQDGFAEKVFARESRAQLVLRILKTLPVNSALSRMDSLRKQMKDLAAPRATELANTFVFGSETQLLVLLQE